LYSYLCYIILIFTVYIVWGDIVGPIKTAANLLVLFFLILAYFYISVLINIKVYLIISVTFFISIFLVIFLATREIVKKDLHKTFFKKVGPANIIYICLVFFICKSYIDYRNLQILRKVDKNMTVYSLVKDSMQTSKETANYNKVFKSSIYENNTIYYTDDLKPALNLINAYIDKAKLENTKLFGSLPSEPLTIQFDYNKDIFNKRDLASKDLTGVYFERDKKTYIYIEDCFKDVLAGNSKSEQLRHTLLHEYTHHLFFEFVNHYQISENKIPAWFIEGISEYIGYGGENGIPPKTMLDFSQLNSENQWKDYSNKGYSTYEQSHYAVRQLILMNGEKAIQNILLKTKDMDFTSAFNSVVGVSFKEYEKSLNEDFKKDWKNYNKMIPFEHPYLYTDEKIQCLKEYLQVKPDNIYALMYLAQLYESTGLKAEARAVLNTALQKKSDDINALIELAELYDNIGLETEARSVLNTAASKKPDNYIVWRRLAIICIEMNDFDSAINAYEKEIKLSENPANGYISIAPVLLIKDINKAVEAAQKAKETDKSKFINSQVQELLNYKSSIKNGKPYEGLLRLIKSDFIFYNNLKKALIDKTLKEYPDIKCSARSELEKIKRTYN
jgi:tetratricopeptide (TPR) repeat protein